MVEARLKDPVRDDGAQPGCPQRHPLTLSLSDCCWLTPSQPPQLFAQTDIQDNNPWTDLHSGITNKWPHPPHISLGYEGGGKEGRVVATSLPRPLEGFYPGLWVPSEH